MPIDHLPKRYQPAAYRIRAAVMGDGTAFLIAGCAAILKGLALLGEPFYLHPVEELLDNGVWAVLWLLLGGLAMCVMIKPTARIASAIFGMLVGFNVTWSISIAAAAYTYHMNLWWTAGAHLMIASFMAWAVWRGSRQHIQVEVE